MTFCKSLAISGLMLLMLPQATQAAYNNGTIIGSGSIFDIDLTPEFLNDGAVGGSTEALWNLGRTYPVKVYCSTPITAEMAYPINYRLENDLPGSTTNPGYQKLNDYLDIKVDVWINGDIGDYRSVPWAGIGSNGGSWTCTPPSSILDERGMSTGSKGRVTFKITKRIVNGIEIRSTPLVRVLGSVSPSPAPPGSTGVTAAVILNPLTITVPDKCVINEGTPITIEFGTIPGTSEQLNGSNYSQQVPVHMECEGGSFEEGYVSVEFGIRPTGAAQAPFNPEYLGTTGSVDRKDLGIKLTTAAGVPVYPNVLYRYEGDVNNKVWNWNLIAAPIANPSSEQILEGEFTSAATIVVNFP